MFYSKKLNKLGGIKHCFFSRKGGFSTGLYKSLNCGKGSNDNRKKILKNLGVVKKKMKIKGNNLILMHQIHSNKVVEIKKKKFREFIKCDAVITKENSIALAVLTADCVPILLFDYQNNIIGCIHAGWKGALNGIIENTIKKIKKMNSTYKIVACIGPCIGKKSYEVDKGFFNRFILRSKKNRKYFSSKNKFKKLFNLRKFVADKLAQSKVSFDHINYDTFKDENNFFSYRRSVVLNQADYGRCIAIIKKI